MQSLPKQTNSNDFDVIISLERTFEMEQYDTVDLIDDVQLNAKDCPPNQVTMPEAMPEQMRNMQAASCDASSMLEAECVLTKDCRDYELDRIGKPWLAELIPLPLARKQWCVNG